MKKYNIYCDVIQGILTNTQDNLSGIEGKSTVERISNFAFLITNEIFEQLQENEVDRTDLTKAVVSFAIGALSNSVFVHNTSMAKPGMIKAFIKDCISNAETATRFYSELNSGSS